MEPKDDAELSKLLREWKVEDAPRSLDERVLGARRPWWKALLAGSVRVPMPVVVGFAVLLVAMSAALLRPRPGTAPVPTIPAAPASVNLADFRPVEGVQVRIMRSIHEAR